MCGACTTACPVFLTEGNYIGPAAIVAAHRFVFDSRDRGREQRLDILAADDGAFRCRGMFKCTESCPRGIKVTKAIQEVKRAALFQSF
jgi:succinate dehydrogenase / fumarate reductase iron-sulfur subunit